MQSMNYLYLKHFPKNAKSYNYNNMTKSKLLIVFSLLLIGLGLNSCDDEPIDPALLNVVPTTDCGAPLFFEASDFIGGTSVSLGWEAAPGTSAWQIQYGIEGFAVGSGMQITATENSATIPGLNSTNNYEFYIRTMCGAESYSGWVGPIGVGESMGSCAQPTGVTAVRSAGNTEITVSWAAVAGVPLYEIQYGPDGFALGSGTVVNSTTNTKTITGVATTAYDFYVRSRCTATDSSSWTGPISVDASGVAPAGDYWPTAIGNQWVWNLNGVEQDPYAIVSTNTIGGFSYYTFTTPVQPNTATTRIRKASGNYYIKTEQVTHVTPMPGTTTGNEVIILKDNVPVGGTWTDSFVQTTTYTGMSPITLNISIVCTIEAKDVTVTVNGTTYNNVIKVNRVTTAGTDVYNGSYWFAKNIGPIRVQNMTNIQELESYIVN